MLRLMLVTDRHLAPDEDLLAPIAAVRGDAPLWLHLREKDLPDFALAALAIAARHLLAPPHTLSINTAVDVARSAGAGLHLPEGAPLPAGSLPRPFGRSIHESTDLVAVLREAPDYLLFGPIFATPSKPGHAGTGLDVLRGVARAAAPVPVFAIGGMTPERVGDVLAAGAYGVAIRSAWLTTRQPADEVRRFREAIEETLSSPGR